MKIRRVITIFSVLLLIGCTGAKDEWEDVRKLDSMDKYELFVKKYPNNEYTVKAKERIIFLREKKEFEDAIRMNTKDSYEKFIKVCEAWKFNFYKREMKNVM